MKCFKITISGKVQGVGFRYSAKSMARALGIRGIVKNLPYNEVYIEAEGTDLQLEEFIKWCKTGPEYARVTNTLIFECELKGYTSFEIVH